MKYYGRIKIRRINFRTKFNCMALQAFTTCSRSDQYEIQGL